VIPLNYEVKIMKYLTCPYCNKSFNHDYDDPPEDNEIVELNCPNCEKNFTARASWSLDYFDEKKAPCLNGGEHEFEPVFHAPRHWPDWIRCKNCCHEIRGRFVDL
jgi:uncharacterized protein YbaR (Trm112 family)